MRQLLLAAALSGAIVATFAVPASGWQVPVVAAYRAGQAQGHVVAVRGRADIRPDMEHQGTDVNLVDDKGHVIFIGFVPKLNEYAFPQLASLNGRNVTMYGVIEIYRGRPATQLINTDQLRGS